MNDSLSQRVRAAAVAAWWTILIGALWMTGAWLAYLAILSARPGWVLTLWGGGELTWPKVQTLMLWFFATFKLILFVAVLLAIWLTLWARALKRSNAQGG